MTTREFISKTYNTPATRERNCSSVFTDYQGVVYSYGYHYPLAFNVRGMDFINTAGYSNTTAKHINWAFQALPADAISVQLHRDEARVIAGGVASDHEKLEAIKNALTRELDILKAQMLAKKRKDTMIYRNLKQNFDRVFDAWTTVITNGGY